ncbi:MAG: BMP family ABC transporter substrate-binding protein [Candidatus Thermofonsia Clade 1 bacterium]|uniref:BMP family ABC transporter substrate-binding protein n=1 Tax=Candidatus Thermofonsia Clade 1 bacterium TaxID=2364210 RepID=A0A2M8NZH8_9CHLR|nr:MAG: BMP family ABC transporter substrate-binding protein [Candidatus Thermofonsia Clade 1 bacterium]
MKRILGFALVVALALTALQLGVVAQPSRAAGPKLCLVTDVGEIDDRSFNQSAYEGLVKAAELLDGEEAYIETQNATDYASNIQALVEEGCQVIVTVGFALGDATIKAAEQYPDVYFIGVDQFQATEIKNVVGLIFPEAKAGFLAGVLAARMSRSGIVAAVLGTDQVPPVVFFKEGFEAGARYVNPDIRLISTYHPGGLDRAFTDPEWGAQTAKQAFDQGADVIFGAGGKTGNGALEEVAKLTTPERPVYCIGVDTDQWLTVPAAHPCLISSAMKLITDGVVDIIKLWSEGNPPSGNYVGDVGLAPFHDFEDVVPDEVKKELEEVAELLLSGKLDPMTGKMIE